MEFEDDPLRAYSISRSRDAAQGKSVRKSGVYTQYMSILRTLLTPRCALQRDIEQALKAARNLKKHKVSFEDAASVFGDPASYTFADPDHSVGEERWLNVWFVPGKTGTRGDIYSSERKIPHYQRTSCYKTREENI